MKKAKPSVYAITEAEMTELLRLFEVNFGMDVFKKLHYFKDSWCSYTSNGSIVRNDRCDKGIAFRYLMERIKTRPAELPGGKWYSFTEVRMWRLLARLCAGASVIKTPNYEFIPIPPELAVLALIIEHPLN